MHQDDAQDADHEAAAEMLRLVLPLLNKHKIPPTPSNYALWYSYVCGEDQALRTEIDKLLAEETPFTQQINDDLFNKHLRECDISAYQEIRSRITAILSDLLQGLAQLGADTGHYEQHLQVQINRMDECRGLNELEGLLRVLAEETKGMRQSTQALKLEFEQKSRDIQSLQTELEQVKKSASSDPLTGLPNRRTLLDALFNQQHNGSTSRHSLLMLDIDHFKEFNDQHGHLTGDRVLRFVADVIRQQTKGQDTPARFGGEEFAILLPETALAGAVAVAESIRHHLSNAKLVRSGSQQPLGRITISAGCATSRRGEDSMELIERADQALYLAKERGRNRVIPETEL